MGGGEVHREGMGWVGDEEAGELWGGMGFKQMGCGDNVLRFPAFLVLLWTFILQLLYRCSQIQEKNVDVVHKLAPVRHLFPLHSPPYLSRCFRPINYVLTLCIL